jgi:hypothetical protein
MNERKKAPVFYWPWIPIAKRGLACRWFILIRSKFKDDDGLHRHEQVHIAQQSAFGLPRYLWRYYTDPYFKADVEAAAFRYGSGYSAERTLYILVEDYHIQADIASESVNKVYE